MIRDVNSLVVESLLTHHPPGSEARYAAYTALFACTASSTTIFNNYSDSITTYVRSKFKPSLIPD